MIEIKQESMSITSSPNNLVESDRSSSVSNRVPERIVGKATLKGEIYFMIKWKRLFEAEFGM